MSSGQTCSSKCRTILPFAPAPRPLIAASSLSGRGGSNATSRACSIASGSVMMTASAAFVSCCRLDAHAVPAPLNATHRRRSGCRSVAMWPISVEYPSRRRNWSRTPSPSNVGSVNSVAPSCSGSAA